MQELRLTARQVKTGRDIDFEGLIVRSESSRQLLIGPFHPLAPLCCCSIGGDNNPFIALTRPVAHQGKTSLSSFVQNIYFDMPAFKNIL